MANIKNIKSADIQNKTLPHSLEAEKSVLGCMLLEKGALYLALQSIKSDDFYSDANSIIFSAICSLIDDEIALDLVTLTEKLKSEGNLEKAGSPYYISELLDSTITAANAEYYINIVKEHSLKRKMIDAAEQVVMAGFDTSLSAEKFINIAEREIFSIAEEKIKSSCVPIKEVIDTTIEKLHKLSERKEFITGVSTRFTKLDQLLLGFQNSDLIIIAARPSMGKTSLALNIAANAAHLDRKSVVFFSLEMSREQLSMRMICSEAKIDSNKMRRGMLSMAEWELVQESAAKLRTSPLWIDDSPSISVFEITSKVRRLKMDGKCDLVIIDYLQLVDPRDSRVPREQQISEISRSFKSLAKEFDIPVVALSQLNRQPEGRTDKRPVLSDLRESGAIEQDADVIMFLYRDEAYNKEKSQEKGLADIIVAKQRNGPTDTVKVAFLKKYTLFANFEEELAM